MRPVNLIPPEERRGDRAPLRRGPVAYALVGGLVAVLVLVVALVLTGNSVTEKESELAELEAQRDAVAQEAQALAPYAQFAAMQQNRESTVISLAESRFDWERVLRELALVIPSDVWLVELIGAAGGDGSDDEVTGPNLEIQGCARDHEAVARFIASLEDIDGVTRVGLSNSVRQDTESGSSDCNGRNLPASFQAQAVFDNVVASSAAPAPTEPAPAEPGDEDAQEGDSEAEPATASAEEEQGNGKKASNVVPGVAR